jgi:hypothetical protein
VGADVPPAKTAVRWHLETNGLARPHSTIPGGAIIGFPDLAGAVERGSRWEAAANPWLGAIARCSRTGSSNPSPSRTESANYWFRCGAAGCESGARSTSVFIPRGETLEGGPHDDSCRSGEGTRRRTGRCARCRPGHGEQSGGVDHPPPQGRSLTVINAHIGQGRTRHRSHRGGWGRSCRA